MRHRHCHHSPPPPVAKLKPHRPAPVRVSAGPSCHSPIRLRVVSTLGQVLIRRLRDADGQEGDHEHA